MRQLEEKYNHIFDSQECPPMWLEGEYAFFFTLALEDKLELHQNILKKNYIRI